MEEVRRISLITLYHSLNIDLKIDYMGATELQYIDDDDGEYNDNDDDEQ